MVIIVSCVSNTSHYGSEKAGDHSTVIVQLGAVLEFSFFLIKDFIGTGLRNSQGNSEWNFHSNINCSVKTSHGSGLDGISSFLIMITLARPLSYLFNCSLLSRSYLEFWKISTVAPILKKAQLMNNQMIGLFKYFQSSHSVLRSQSLINYTAILMQITLFKGTSQDFDLTIWLSCASYQTLMIGMLI